MKVLAIVPARSGSKGLPDKNIRLFHGRPLLAWSIQSCLDSSFVNKVVISTDSPAYAQIGIEYGAEAPFLRPQSLSSDESSSVDVVLHCLSEMERQGETFDIVVLAEPTSPLRAVSDIDDAVHKILSAKAEAAVSICLAEALHPKFMYQINDESLMTPFMRDYSSHIRRQDLEPVYILEGSVYASLTDTLKSRKTFYHENTAGIIVPPERSIEIDSELDFKIAEFLFQHPRVVR